MSSRPSSKKTKVTLQVKHKNQLLGLMLAVGLIGTVYEAYQYQKISTVNSAIVAGETVNTEDFLFNKKFADAYHQGETKNYKLAVQGFGQLTEMPNKKQDAKIEVSPAQLSNIQFNIGNNLFHGGLRRLVNPDGTLHNDAIYAFMQAKTAYEQALKLNPFLQAAKFNLSLLLTVFPENIKPSGKDQSGMEVSNLPQGLP